MAISNTKDPQLFDNTGVEPIAIIGASCRFSGNASSSDGLWQLLSKGMTSWASNARSRFKLDSFWHPHAQLSGSFNPRGLHLLQQDPAVFDNDFFGISGVEARAIDPQQRIMLEVAYEAFENAGIPLERLEGSRTGVFCAVSYQDYDHIQGRDPEVSPMHRFSGTGPSILAGRVAYVFDLRGPSMAVDTACSSTLVALHNACRALRGGEADQILVGGSNLILDPDKITVISSMQFLSPHGRCYAFDSRASGYGRGEGSAAVLLKPLSAAIRDGDTIRAVIRGSATESDGKTPGITLPSSNGQYDTIRRAYEAAGLDPNDTPYVEAHGTGTNAGDNCEVTAFTRAFCRQRAEKLFVGSVKSNLGHTESTSGLAGLMKVLLMLENGAIVPNPTFSSANPKLELEIKGIQVPTKFQKWPVRAIRRASINSSGYGGTNAHVILEAWTDEECTVESSPAVNGEETNGHTKARSSIFVLSHQREDGLMKLASSWKKFITASQTNHRSLSLDDLAFTLSSRRTRLAHRTAVIASDFQELLDGINKVELGSLRPVRASSNARLCFIFTGQGAQWSRMGLELTSIYPVFSQSLKRSERELIRLGATWRLTEELEKDKYVSRINEAELSQPCCTAIQIALVDLLASWNVHPDFVCGHSSGEIAAAYAAGALSETDAIKVAYFRGQAVQHLKATEPELRGAMLAVGLSEANVREYLSNYEETVTVACINSPSSVTLSGDVAAIDELVAVFETKDVFNRKLAVDVAYHSHHMAVVEEYYLSALEHLKPMELKPNVRMVSSVTCGEVQGQDLDGAYWTQNLLCPVRFSDALCMILRPDAGNSATSAVMQPTIMLEIGPHAALRGPATQAVKSLTAQNSVSYTSCLKRYENAVKTSLDLAGELFTRGVPIDLNCVNNPDNTRKGKVLTNLPSYNWHHEKVHWNESRRSAAYRLRKFPRHDLLGNAAADSISAEPSWRMYIRLSEMPWIKGHCVDGQIVFAAAGFITMIVEALKRQCITSNCSWKRKVVQFKQVTIGRPLLIQDDAFGAEVFTLLRPYSQSSRQSTTRWQEFRIYSVSQGNESTEHCRGLVTVSVNSQKLVAMPPLPNGIAHNPWMQLEVGQFYKDLHALGHEYSDCFANLETVLARPGESKCDLVVPDVKSIMPSEHQQPHCLHPTTLEGCFQACLPGLKFTDSFDSTHVVTAIDELCISTDIELKPGEKLSILTKITPYGLRQHSSDVVATKIDEESKSLIQVKGIKFSSLGNYRSAGDPAFSEGALCHEVEWLLDPFTSSRESIVNHCSRSLVNRNQRLRELCDPFCRSLVRHTLAQLTPEDKAATTGFLQFFLKWMHDHDLCDAEPMSRSIEETTSAVGAPGEMLVQLGPHIREILRGEVESLSLLLNDDLLYRLYFEDDCLNRCHAQLAEYLKLVQFKVPNLRILEVGGGTGSLTFTLLEALYGDRRDHPTTKGTYVFTDVSTSFFPNVQEKMKRFEPFMEFKRLDIEQSPAQQGFELGSFDVIVASNVVHATHKICLTLNNLRPLLKPGGQIAMAELTAPSLRWGILGGGLAGWWMGADEGRVSSPLLPTSQWDEVLLNSGFSGVSLEMRDYESDEEHEVSLIISHVVDSQLKSSAEEIVIVSKHSNDAVAIGLHDSLVAQFSDAAVWVLALPDAKRSCGTYIFLLESSDDFTSDTSNYWESVLDIICDAQAVLWVTKGAAISCTEPRRAPITGLGQSLRSKNNELKFYTLDLDPKCTSASQISSTILQTYERYLGPDASPYSSSEWEISTRNGSNMVPRLLTSKIVDGWVEDTISKYHPREEYKMDPNRSLGLRIQSVGMLDSLYWADHPSHSQSPSSTQIRVRLEHTSLNFKDMMTITGQLEGNSALLIEGSGTVTEIGDLSRSSFSIGDRVCFFSPDGLATVSNIDANHACVIPEDLSMETAASLPLAYSTALFTLGDVARLKQGDSILIHSGAGAVGQAAIAIARFLGAGDVFVTTSNEARNELVKQKFGIPADRVLSSHDPDFGERILELTGGRGVDVVLSSLSGDGFATSCSAVASFGRIVHIGSKDIDNNARLEMGYLKKNATFSVVDMTLVVKERPILFNELLQNAIKLVQRKALDLIGPITTTHASKAGENLRTMQAGNHVGKLVLSLDSSLPLKVQPQKPELATLRNDSSYLVAGGAGGFDKDIVKFLAKLGAKRIITFENSVGQEPDAEELAEEVKREGADLVIIKGSIDTKPSLIQLKNITQGMPIKGIILGDTTAKDVSTEAFTPTAMGISDLYANLKDNLDFFILLGSTATVLGSSGQEPRASNAFRAAFARHQASLEFPVRAIDIDMGGDEGTTTASEQKIKELSAVINYAIQNPVPETPAQAHIICGAERMNPTSESTRRDAKFSHIWSRATHQITKDTDDSSFDAQKALTSSLTPSAAIEATYTGLKQKLARLLAISAKEIQPDRSVASYGVDSLISVELRNWISGYLGGHVQMLELMSSTAMMQLAEVIARRSRFVPVGVFASEDKN